MTTTISAPPNAAQTNVVDPAAITANWGFPNQMLVGPGRLAELPSLCKEHGITRPLLVTDNGMRDLPIIADTLTLLRDSDLSAELFADVQGNPVEANVDEGIIAYRAGNHDGIVGLGGGSALDVAKAIALMIGQTRPIWDFEDIGDYWKRADASAIAPVIAIPSTAGTGSEVGRASVITNTEAHRKVIVFHPLMLPKAVILDPEVTVGLPAHLTAATGIDAFVHNFEAWCAPGFHPMADGIALQGMRLIATALPRAYDDDSDLEARTQMLAAASMGAMAFQKGLGGVHAIAHPVGAIHGTHHGLANAIILPYVMRRNESAIADRMSPVASVLGLENNTFGAVLEWVLCFRQQLGIPETLADVGVNTDSAAEIGRLAESDPSAATNPITLNAQDYSDVFVRVVKGK